MNSENKKPYLIGICGGSASGKTSFSNVLYKFLGPQKCLLFSMDNYFFGPNDEERKHLSEYNFDRPEALDIDLAYNHLKTLLNNQPIQMPIYDFTVSRRMKETNTVYPNKVIIFEGIFALHDKRIRDLMDLKLFVDLDGDLRLARRVHRDIKDRARSLDTVIDRYHKFVKPAFEKYIGPTRKHADIIIPRGAANSLALDLITSMLMKVLGDNES